MRVGLFLHAKIKLGDNDSKVLTLKPSHLSYEVQSQGFIERLRVATAAVCPEFSRNVIGSLVFLQYILDVKLMDNE